jgi:hypothetical protein
MDNTAIGSRITDSLPSTIKAHTPVLHIKRIDKPKKKSTENVMK